MGIAATLSAMLAAMLARVVPQPAPVAANDAKPAVMRVWRHGVPSDAPPATNPWQVAKPMPGVVAPNASSMAQDDGLSGLYNYVGGSGLFGEGLSWFGYPYLAELAQRAEYRQISETIAKEMTRKWVRIQASGSDDGKAEKVRKLELAFKRLDVQGVFRRCAELDGLFGRAQIYIDTGQTDDHDELRTPLAITQAKIAKGSLKRLTVVEPIWTYPHNYESIDPLHPHYYKPRAWWVQGRLIHETRLLTLISREMPDLLKPAYSFGGLSLSQMVHPYVQNWLRTRQSVSDMLHTFSVSGIKTNMAAMMAEAGEDALFRRAAFFNKSRDNRGFMMLDKDTEEYFNTSAPLGGLDHLQAQSQEQMASVARIPLVVLLGITPSGLNASSDGEIRTFYAWIESQQEQLFFHHLTTVLNIVQLSEFGEIDPEIGFRFEPLWQLDDEKRAQVRQVEAQTATTYIQAGVLSPHEEREKIARDEDSPYASLDLADQPDPQMPNPADEGDPSADATADDDTEGAPPPRTMSRPPPFGRQAPERPGGSGRPAIDHPHGPGRPLLSRPRIAANDGAMDAEWDENKHKRGHAGNKGQFSSTGGGSSAKDLKAAHADLYARYLAATGSAREDLQKQLKPSWDKYAAAKKAEATGTKAPAAAKPSSKPASTPASKPASTPAGAVAQSMSGALSKLPQLAHVKISKPDADGSVWVTAGSHLNKSGHVITLPGTAGSAGVAVKIMPQKNRVAFYEINNGLGAKAKGLGSKMVDAIMKQLPEGYTASVHVDLSEGFWSKMENRYGNKLIAQDAEFEESDHPRDHGKFSKAAGSSKPVNISAWKKVGPQLGSNPGGSYEDANGKVFYAKQQKSEHHARNEVLASKLYQAAGSPVVDVRLAKQNDAWTTITPWLEGAKEIGKSQADKDDAAADYATHAWLANRDAVGVDYKNQARIGGKMHTMDVGGALAFRAQGEKKTDFGDSVDEWASLRNAKSNQQTHNVYGGMTPKQMHASAAKVSAVPAATIRAIVDEHGHGSASDKRTIADRLIKRRNDIVKRLAAIAQDASFSEADHPRGQPENAGEFAKGSGGKVSATKGATAKSSATKNATASPVAGQSGQRPAASKQGAGMLDAISNGKVRTQADGSPLPPHVIKAAIPPAWKDVKFSPDPNADVIAIGKDSKGKVQSVRSAAYEARQAAAKFSRIADLSAKFDALVLQNDKMKADPARREEADCLDLIMKMGCRPGSEADTGAAYKGYGATTLEGRHVVIAEDGSVNLTFVPGKKKGQTITLPVRDPALAEMLKQRAAKAGPDGQLFNTDEKKLSAHSHLLNGGIFKTKDFRTHLGTKTAASLIATMQPPVDKKSFEKAVKAVAVHVAGTLGNTPSVALESYIAPQVFDGWRL